MRVSEVLQASRDLVEILRGRPEFDVYIGAVFQSPNTIADPQNANLRANGLDRSSGIYLVADMSDEVLYVGKATADNLHPELWGKLGTPVGDAPPVSYPSTYWSRRTDISATILSDIEKGNLQVVAFALEPTWVASLFEVYLHCLCTAIEGRLPPLNSRIG